jgi:hypothetical protein
LLPGRSKIMAVPSFPSTAFTWTRTEDGNVQQLVGAEGHAVGSNRSTDLRPRRRFYPTQLLGIPPSLPRFLGGATPLFVFDAGSDPVKLQRGLEGSGCQILVRLRAGRRFYADPSLACPPAQTGRPRRYELKMKCSDPSTWPEPSTEYT